MVPSGMEMAAVAALLIQKSQLQPSARPKKYHGLDRVESEELEFLFTHLLLKTKIPTTISFHLVSQEIRNSIQS